MEPIILNGKALADEMAIDLKNRVSVLKSKNVIPKLVVVTASADEASKVYVRNKQKRCEEIGIEFIHIETPKLTREIMEEVKAMNCPVIVQMPFESDELTLEDLGEYITAENDVDGFVNPKNVADLAMGKTPLNYPCTPMGVMDLLKEYKIKLNGKAVCILGRSNIVGRPLARLMEHEGATVTLCHSKTAEFDKYYSIKYAEIVVSATGVRNTIDNETMRWYDIDENDLFCKTFVDVGMNRDENNKLCGDISQEIKEQGYAYTPVPGGVGAMTVIELMKNVVERYEREEN